MSWLNRPEQKSTNPATKFLEWSSNDKCFKYYDKTKGENVLHPLPLKFVILEHYHTVKGWNDASESGIYSNEVYGIGTEPITVKSFKGGEIAEGLYKDIKTKVNNAGGKYHRSIYAVTNDLEIINISIKGSAVSSYSDFVKEFGDYNFDKHWIEVSEAKDGKKGSIKYSTPVFKKSTAIKDASKIAPFAETLQDYITQYTSKSTERVASEVDKYEEATNEEDENLAF